jgi:hypothetical protein
MPRSFVITSCSFVIIAFFIQVPPVSRSSSPHTPHEDGQQPERSVVGAVGLVVEKDWKVEGCGEKNLTKPKCYVAQQVNVKKIKGF